MIAVLAGLLGRADVRHATDLDGDGFCPEGGEEVFRPESAKPGSGMAICPTDQARDCDDDADWRFPGAEEQCDGVDGDCDGQLNENGGTSTGTATSPVQRTRSSIVRST